MNKRSEREITDAGEVCDIVLEHFVKECKVVWKREINAIMRRTFVWLCEIESISFTGTVIINRFSGAVIAVLKANPTK